MKSIIFYLLPLFFFFEKCIVTTPFLTAIIFEGYAEALDYNRSFYKKEQQKTILDQVHSMTFFLKETRQSRMNLQDFTPQLLAPRAILKIDSMVHFDSRRKSGTPFQYSVNGTTSTASNNPQQFCQLVSIIEETTNTGCDSSFVRRIGDNGINEECYYLIPDGEGNYFLAGSDGDNSLILQVDPSGNIIAQRTYDFTNGSDFISNIMVDDDGFLVGSARDQINTNTTNVLFKINWQTGNLVWAKKIDNPSYNRFDRVFQHPSNGNYIFCGLTTSDNYIIESNKNTGNVTWQFVSDYTGNADVYSGYFTTSNAIYYAGQGRLGGGLDEIRPTLSKFDLNGNLLWAKIHLRSPSQPSRLYNMDLFIENDTIVNCGRGSLNGDDLTNSQLLFYKTNINGNLIWAKSYSITGGTGVAGYGAHPIPGGYIVQGTYDEGGLTPKFFIARLNKAGNVVWAKQINAIVSGITKSLALVDGDFVVFAAQTTQYDFGLNNDMLFGKISLGGEVVGSGCTLVQDINLVANNIANPYDGSQVPSTSSPIFPYSSSIHSPLAADLPISDIPGCECTDFSVDTCANGLPLHTVPDAVLQSITAECIGGSPVLTTVICNADSVALPANTPISLYDENPSAAAATLLTTQLTTAPIPSGACLEFTISFPVPTNQLIYAVINDNGSTPTPFDLATDFPNTATQECDFTNNLASFTLNYIPPVLNLGPDLTNCLFEVTELDAGPEFASYHWNNGSTSQTLTTTQPGTYAVTVTDSCGSTQTDEITLSQTLASAMDIGYESVELCVGDSFTFTVSGFDSYQWSPASLVDCPTCPTVTISPNVDTCFIVVGTASNGCLSADTVCVNIVTDTATTYQNLLICEGDTTNFFGTKLTQPGTYTAIDTTGNCIKVSNLTLGFFPKTSIEFTTDLACPFLFDGKITATPIGGTPPYSYAWETGTSTTNLLGGIDVGNYSVTVTDANACAVVDSVELTAAMRPSVSSEVQDASCFGINDGVLTLIADDPSLQFIFKGSPPSHQTVYDSIWPGGDQYFTVDTFGCEWVSFFFVDAPDKIVLELPNSVEADMCDSMQIMVESLTSPLTYSWSPADDLSCTDCPNPVANPFSTTTYYLTVQDSNGCTASDSIHVLINFEGKAYIPNAFSPNNDGLNDVFYVLSRCVTEVRMFRVFDRWGELVFEKSNTPPNDPLYGWNGKFRGKDMNADVFVYHIVVVLADGRTQEYKGDVTLLR